jgi:hypothetical protein
MVMQGNFRQKTAVETTVVSISAGEQFNKDGNRLVKAVTSPKFAGLYGISE